MNKPTIEDLKFMLNVNDNSLCKSRTSCIVIALKNARFLSCRNHETGIETGQNFIADDLSVSSSNFMSLTLYLILLETLGRIFRPIELDTEIEQIQNPIYHTIRYFGTPHDDKRTAQCIRSLRNALAHQYSLCNIPDKGKDDLEMLHKFNLQFSTSSEMIKFPFTKVDRNNFFDSKDSSTFTKISVPLLIDFIESIISYVNQKLESNMITSRIESIEELNSRYTII